MWSCVFKHYGSMENGLGGLGAVVVAVPSVASTIQHLKQTGLPSVMRRCAGFR